VTTVTAADGCRLAVHAVGDGPPLLCVPGGPGRAAEYLEDLGGLAATRQLQLLDNRGTGASELPADRSSLQLHRLADDVEDVRRELGLTPADVLGHSAGCPVALLHAGRHGDVVRRLVLVTPSGRPFGWAADDVEEIRAARSGEPWFAEAMEAQQAMEHANPRMRSELEKESTPPEPIGRCRCAPTPAIRRGRTTNLLPPASRFERCARRCSSSSATATH
jgi:pimeloyl-ACP methyl ester carboxylesterase